MFFLLLACSSCPDGFALDEEGVCSAEYNKYVDLEDGTSDNVESEEELYDPIINVIAAKRLYDEQGLDAWGAYKNGSYKKFLKN